MPDWPCPESALAKQDQMRWNHVSLLSEALQEDQYRGVLFGIWEKELAIPMIVLRFLGLQTGRCVCITPVQVGPAGERCQDL